MVSTALNEREAKVTLHQRTKKPTGVQRRDWPWVKLHTRLGRIGCFMGEEVSKRKKKEEKNLVNLKPKVMRGSKQKKHRGKDQKVRGRA